jgi:hypothetical protein
VRACPASLCEFASALDIRARANEPLPRSGTIAESHARCGVDQPLRKSGGGAVACSDAARGGDRRNGEACREPGVTPALGEAVVWTPRFQGVSGSPVTVAE